MRRKSANLEGENLEEENNAKPARRLLSGRSDRDAADKPRRGYHPLCAAEGRRAQSGAKGLGRHDRRPAAQCEIHRSSLSRLYPQPRSGAAPVGAVGLSALEYLAAAAPERTRNSDHRPAVDRAI